MPFVNKIKQLVRPVLHGLKKSLDTWSNGSCLVLLYHRVSDYTTDPQLLCVTPENFDAQLGYLRSNYNVLTVEEFYSVLINKMKFPDRSVLLTFDDGYRDNYRYALPLLEKHGLQALFYICTGNFNTEKEFWWDEVERCLLLSKNPDEKLSFRIGNENFTSVDASERRSLYTGILPALRALAVAERTNVLREIRKQTGNEPERPSHRSMTWDDLILMAKSSSAVIGAHTVNHPSLAFLDRKDQEYEIMTSKQQLEKVLGKNIEHFSYPFGTQGDYTAETIDICRKAGFKMVISNFPYIANRKSDLFQIPRFLVRDWNAEMFRKKLKSFGR
ncbi:MAG TPA: polysaccharide deacetylase family protein [Bacteroidia bacterium]|nr:polysaccharide deacetylase family protein [Bacteroidia bacterium]